MTIEEKVEQGLFSQDYLVGDDEMVRLLPSPDVVHPVVCGEPGRNRLMLIHGIYVLPTTKTIDLPQDWSDRLVGK